MKNANASRNNLLPTRNKINVKESKNLINNESSSSTFTTKSRQSQRPCPLMQIKVDYNKLQELAKEVDEEQICYDTPSETETPNNQENEQVLFWTVDPSNYKRCTCNLKKWMSFEEVVHRFKRSETDILQKNISNEGTHAPPNSVVGRQRTKTWVKTTLHNHRNSLAKPTNRTNESQLENLLKNLQNEYFAMCSKYHALAVPVKIGSKRKEKLIKLKNIEKRLFRKEQEIDTVMLLYKDLVELRGEVRRLKQPKQPAVMSANLPKHGFRISKPAKKSI